MSNFMITAIIYAIAGLAFSIIMFAIAGRIRSFTTPTGTALMIDLGKFGKFQTGNAFIGLAMLGAGLMVAIPAYYLYLDFNSGEPVRVSVPFRPPTTESIKLISAEDSTFLPAKPPQITFCKSELHQGFLLQGDESQASIDVQVWYDGKPWVKVRSDKPQAVSDYTLPDMRFEQSDLPANSNGPGALTTAPPPPAPLSSLSDPPAVTESRMAGSALPVSHP
jgi:hypothetical protein